MSGRHYSLFAGSNLVVDFAGAEDALVYVAEHADALLDSDYGLLVFDSDGMCEVALVDARKLPN